jgi:hypothetical protein
VGVLLLPESMALLPWVQQLQLLGLALVRSLKSWLVRCGVVVRACTTTCRHLVAAVPGVLSAVMAGTLGTAFGVDSAYPWLVKSLLTNFRISCCIDHPFTSTLFPHFQCLLKLQPAASCPPMC